MSNYGVNGMTAELGQYETPFADIPVTKEADRESEAKSDMYSNYLMEVDSPFSRTFETASANSSVTPAGEEFVQFIGELNNEEFNNAVYELAAEMEDSWSSKISNEIAMGSNYIPFTTQKAREYLAPVIRESEAMVDRVAEHFSGNNLGDHSETEIESYFDSLEFDHLDFSPAQEQFFGSIFNKIKNVVKKGVDLAKKGISIVGKLMPINIILNKIKGLIRPLLDKVLKFATGKLPKNLQPYAQTLAKKFLNLESSEETESAHDTESNMELESIQTELDNHISQLVFSPSDFEAGNLVMNYETSYENIERTTNYETGMADNQPSLPVARQQFINELSNLQHGESPAPAIERFIPVAIMALQPVIKLAISIIGRQKVINFLADLLAKLVAKYVPAEVAKPLAASIVDVGLSAIGFETYETQKPDLAYEAIANTIQETIQNMTDMTETSLNDREDLTMQLLEAFETAAANNFPPQYIREDLRPTKHKALWILMPRNGPGHYYKKFTHVFDISIDPPASAAVTTFRGLPLANFLRDKYGLDTSKTIKAKVHIYEATKETRLHRISKYENLPGLNARQPKAWIQLLPLTKQAASLLIKEPSLGKDPGSRNLSSRYRTMAGQRFYYLEIDGVRLRIPPVDRSGHHHKNGRIPNSSTESHSGDIQAVINFIKSEITLNYYFSEEDAKAVVTKLNSNDYLGAAQSIRNSVKKVLNEMLMNNVSSKVKIIHEAIPELYLEQYSDQEAEFNPLEALGKVAGKEIVGKLVEQLVEQVAGKAYEALTAFFKARAVEFKDAQAQPQDGVTIKISWKNIPGMSAIRTMINAIQGKLSIPNLGDLQMPKLSAPEISIVADKKFE
jgi:hypothetical protein